MTERKHPYSKENFLKRKALGDIMENKVADALKDAGIDVEQPQMEDGLPEQEYTKFQIDMIANGKIIEVKGRRFYFQDVKSFPYPTIFVESKGGFDKKDRKPDFYVNISHKTGKIIALDVKETEAKWVVSKEWDRDRGFSFNMYVSETKDWVDFDELVRRLQ